jgi:two-component system, OmpR family, phosphate regulon sensor histidine kinase PhoR
VRLSSRYTLLFGVLALGLALLLTFTWSALLDRAAEQSAIGRLRAEEALVAWLVAPAMGDPGALDPLVHRQGRELGARITVIDEAGRVISDSDVALADVPRMENHSGRPEIVEARHRGSGASMRYSTTLDREFLYLADRISAGPGRTGFLRMAIAVDRMRAEESAEVWLGRAAIFGSCLLLFLAGSWASRRFSLPLKRVTDAALAIARGDLKRDPPEEDEPEAAALSEAVRRMKTSFLASLASADAERRLIAMVFEELPSGIVVVGPREEIVQANAAFERLVGAAGSTGRRLIDVLRETEVHELFRRVLGGELTASRTVRRADDVTWDVDVIRLPPDARGTALGILRDTTAVTRTESMRRRFVSDVSHELRTPVASIAAAAETLVDGAPDAQETGDLHRLVSRQARRMHDLIEDLTDLSRIESGSLELHRESVALVPLAREVCNDLAAPSAARRVTLSVSGDPDVTVLGDRRRISQILHNLVDNAIKFSPDGESVEIAIRRGEAVEVSVSDHGPGVPASERERVFQRFYQIDPSRSKARPGTGLGLAIVKHLVALHHGSIAVAGEPGRGAVFRVSFPISS